MSTNHVAIWIDHKEAHILYFDTTKSEIVKSNAEQPHLHHKAHEVGSGKAPPETHYFHAVITAVANANEILIIGPGSAKTELLKHAVSHDPAIAKKIVGVETVDHPTDGQALAFAKTYFHRIDRMRGV